MSLLREIQTSVMQENSPIGPILLKLRFLASRLGSDLLEDWVKHEAEGYPNGIEVPEYRKLTIRYSGTFTGGFGSGMQNAPIPPALIEEFCGEQWTTYRMRQSVAAVDDLLNSGEGGALALDASNLILLLQGKVYQDMACNSVTGSLSKASLVELQYSVRSKILELTIELEKRIPASIDVKIGTQEQLTPAETQTVTQLTNQVFNGNYTAITNSGDNSNISINVLAGEKTSVIEALKNAGIEEHDAVEFAEILNSETPDNDNEPFGPKARAWIGENLSKAAGGLWKAGLTAATKVLTEAAMKYYDLK
jgi:hypothetical protein